MTSFAKKSGRRLRGHPGGYPGLFATIGNIGDRRAMHVANPVQVIVVVPAMHRAAVIPHHEVVLAPAMVVNEQALGGVRDKFVDERLCLVVGHSANTSDV